MNEQEDRLMGDLEDTSTRLSQLLKTCAGSEKEQQLLLEEIERNTQQLQNEFMELQQSEYSSDMAIEKARKVIEQHVKRYSSSLVERLQEEKQKDQVFLVKPGTVSTKIRMNPTYLDGIWHFVVASEDMELGMGYALDMLREINKDGKVRPSEILEMDGPSWEQIGIIEDFDSFLGKMIIIKNASLMSARNFREFEIVLDRNDRSLLVIFIDTIENLTQIFSRHRRFLDTFTAQFTAKSYSEKEMMEYALQYLHENGYALDEAARSRLYVEIRRMPLIDSDGQRKRLINRLEELMEQAENRSIGIILKNLFFAKKDGRGRKLIKIEDFQ